MFDFFFGSSPSVTVLMAAASSVGMISVPQPTEFGDWTVSCDNARLCEAIAGFEQGGSYGEWVIHVTRGALPDAEPLVEAFPAFDDGTKTGDLLIDGRRANFHFDSEGQLVGDANAFLDAMARAQKAEVVDEGGKMIGRLPVTGASAGLRWMDDKQKRAGTVTAIIAKGPAPAAKVPPVPPLPRIAQPAASKAPPRALSAAAVKKIRDIGDDDLCDRDPPGGSPLDVETYRLDAKHSVGVVGCYFGAYQGVSVIVVINEDGSWVPAPIEMPQNMISEDSDSSWRHMLTTADYDPKRRLLTTWAKGRGIGDCGTAASWAWDGRVFRLASFQSLESCVGAQPGMWPSLWQTTNDPQSNVE